MESLAEVYSTYTSVANSQPLYLDDILKASIIVNVIGQEFGYRNFTFGLYGGGDKLKVILVELSSGRNLEGLLETIGGKESYEKNYIRRRFQEFIRENVKDFPENLTLILYKNLGFIDFGHNGKREYGVGMPKSVYEVAVDYHELVLKGKTPYDLGGINKKIERVVVTTPRAAYVFEPDGNGIRVYKLEIPEKYQYKVVYNMDKVRPYLARYRDLVF